MKISEILWKAANERLTEEDDWWGDDEHSNLSCVAAALAEGLSLDDPWRTNAKKSRAVQFLRDLGCKPHSSRSFNSFSDDQRQGARYAWLMFASQYAEEQGL